MNELFSFFEIIGTLAFAISGAMEGIRHKMDLFGVSMMGLVTATGGGVLRDLVIGQIPPRVFLNPKCAIIAFSISLLVFILMRYFRSRMPNRAPRLRERVYFLSDTAGLAAFTVLGIESAGRGNAALLLFVGVITGVGGGVLRDVLSGSVPSIFKKHIYALASAAGAIVNIYLARVLPAQAAMIIGFLVVAIIRGLAAHYRWNLPRIQD